MNIYERPMKLAMELADVLAGITYAKAATPGDDFHQHFELSAAAVRLADELVARRDIETARLALLTYWCDGCEKEKIGEPKIHNYMSETFHYCPDCSAPERETESASDRRARIAAGLGEMKHDQYREDAE